MDTIEEILQAIKRGSSIRSVAMFTPNPELDKDENQALKVACRKKLYDIAKFETVRDIYLQWKVAGVDNKDYNESMKAVFERLKRVNRDPIAYIKAYLKASPDTHEFLWEHGDNGFKSFFPFERKEVELPADVKTIAKYFDATTHYPHYDVDVFFDRVRLFARDRFGEESKEKVKAKKKKLKQWVGEKPLKLW
jgi:hypothetical protein